MRIRNLGMAPLNTTLMGVVKGALDHYGLEHSVQTVFGGSGHAFLINIHKQICPSGPYCWQRSNADPLIQNLGLCMTDLGFFSGESGPEERAGVEKQLRDALDEGIPCSLINMENQMITGYDDTGFFTTQPWAPKVDFPPARLSFETWREFGDECHVNFYTLVQVEPADRLTTVLDSLEYAVDLHRNPAAHNLPDYGIGPEAYANWIHAVAEHGSGHGNWWNATVWSECRAMASRYLAEIGSDYPHVQELAAQLEKTYGQLTTALEKTGDRELDAEKKVPLLEEAREKEVAAAAMLATLSTSLRTGDGR